MKKSDYNKYLINKNIRLNQVRVINSETLKGVVSLNEALREADNFNTDLVQISTAANNVAICRIIDFDKFLYEEKKKKKQNKQKKSTLKELRLSPVIASHDLKFKTLQAKSFIEEGDKVKLMCFFKKGREKFVTKDRGELVILKLADTLKDVAVLEHLPKFEGQNMIAFLIPKKTV